MGEAAGLEKDGVERDLQEALAAQPEVLGEGLRLERREWPTDIGPVDLMCRDEDGGWVAVEVKRIAHDRRGRAARALPRADPPRPGQARLPRHPRRAAAQAAGGHARRVARDPLRRGRPRGAPRRARARADALRGLAIPSLTSQLDRLAGIGVPWSPWLLPSPGDTAPWLRRRRWVNEDGAPGREHRRHENAQTLAVCRRGRVCAAHRRRDRAWLPGG